MASWTPRIAATAGTRAAALVAALRSDIAAGLLKPGDRLPPQRTLAFALGLSPNTVMRAYGEAARQGLLGGEVGRGTYVRAPAADSGGLADTAFTRAETGPIDFSLNLPFPGVAQTAFAESLAAILRGGELSPCLDHQSGAGEARHRAAGAAWIGRLGLAARDEQVVPTAGAQQGILAALMATLRPGDTLLVEKLTYAPIKALARQLGLRLVGVAMDAEGLRPDALEAACRQAPARALYCTPTLQTPTTATMRAARRQEIARLAERQGLIVIEDEVFGCLPPDRPPPLAAYAPDRTILVASLSKSAAAGLRVGYLHAPEAMVAPLRSAVALTAGMPSPLLLEIASRWVEEGTAERLNAVQREHAANRQVMARQLLSGQRISSDSQAMHLWLTLPDHWSDEAFAIAAEQSDVRLQPASRFLATPGPAPAAVRLCLSHEASDARVLEGLARLAALLEGTTRDTADGP